jgi:NADH:ubiquinone oxidoreductase subunit 3 (subunit A)
MYNFKEFLYYPFFEYYNVVLLLLFLMCFSALLLSLSFFISPESYDIEKNSPYECGFNPFEDAREPFEIQFYLVAILFIIFDLEISFLIPWVVVFRFVGFFGYFMVIFFLLILTIGFIYEIYKGALDWS